MLRSESNDMKTKTKISNQAYLAFVEPYHRSSNCNLPLILVKCMYSKRLLAPVRNAIAPMPNFSLFLTVMLSPAIHISNTKQRENMFCSRMFVHKWYATQKCNCIRALFHLVIKMYITFWVIIQVYDGGEYYLWWEHSPSGAPAGRQE